MRQPSNGLIQLLYITNSAFKAEENDIFRTECKLGDGRRIAEVVEFEIFRHQVKEVLSVNLEEMVRAEVQSAYSVFKAPCIVEHAGIVFEDLKERGYPGGLTKPMWDSLGDQFIPETGSKNRRALARSVVAYCDGLRVRTFTGETAGKISDVPRGLRRFYWDTIFVPDTSDGKPGDLTYAEIVGDKRYGLRHKVVELSQCSKAMRQLVEFLKERPSNLWP